jgi:2,4-dichlorophenol 6-monooxygenase
MSMGDVQNFRKLVSMYLEADLSQYLTEADDSFLIWVFNPEYPEHIQHGAVLVPQGPKQWGRHSEEWFVALSRPDVDAKDIPRMVQWAREALGIPDFDPKILGISEWFLETALAVGWPGPQQRDSGRVQPVLEAGTGPEWVRR